MKALRVAVAVAAILLACSLPVAAQHGPCSQEGRWVTVTTTTWIPGYWYYWQEQVGWHYDQWGNQWPILYTYRRWIEGRFVTYTNRYWRPG